MGEEFRKGQVQMAVSRFRDRLWENIEDTVSVEAPLRVTWMDLINGRNGSVQLWAWPEDLPPLALGHILLDVCPGMHSLYHHASVIATGGREFSVTVGDERTDGHIAPPSALKAESLFRAMHAFISAGGHWDGTGCFHRAGVFDPHSEHLLIRAEDIGRHNCLDRLAGWSSLTGTALTDKVLLTSARITASLCAKALRAGFRILVSRSAVTTASIQLAKENQATLVGFARTDEQRLTVFADPLGRLSHAAGD